MQLTVLKPSTETSARAMSASEAGSGVPSAATPVAWELPEPLPAAQAFQEQADRVLLAYKCSVLETFGGPAQYVKVKLDEKSVREDFLDWLWVSFPLAPDTLYALEAPLPACAPGMEGPSSRSHLDTPVCCWLSTFCKMAS